MAAHGNLNIQFRPGAPRRWSSRKDSPSHNRERDPTLTADRSSACNAVQTTSRDLVICRSVLNTRAPKIPIERS